MSKLGLNRWRHEGSQAGLMARPCKQCLQKTFGVGRAQYHSKEQRVWHWRLRDHVHHALEGKHAKTEVSQGPLAETCLSRVWPQKHFSDCCWQRKAASSVLQNIVGYAYQSTTLSQASDRDTDTHVIWLLFACSPSFPFSWHLILQESGGEAKPYLT